MSDFANVNAFTVLRLVRSPAKVRTIQLELITKGQSLWDWPSFAYFYGFEWNLRALQSSEKSVLKAVESAPKDSAPAPTKDWHTALLYRLGVKMSNSDLDRRIEKLGTPLKETVLLLYKDGCGYADAAKVIGVSSTAISSYHTKAINILRSTPKTPRTPQTSRVTALDGDWVSAVRKATNLEQVSAVMIERYIDKLHPILQRLLVARFREGLRMKTIARQLDVSQSYSSILLKTALTEIRAQSSGSNYTPYTPMKEK